MMLLQRTFIVNLFVVAYLKASVATHSQHLCHPLDPLSAFEIQDTVKIVHSQLTLTQHEGEWAFYWITLKEPQKDLLLPYFLQDREPPCASSRIPRRAFVQLVEKKQNIVTEVIVNLISRTVESWDRLPRGTQSTYTTEENIAGEKIAKEDVHVQERCRQMGWSNMSLVAGETWSVAYVEDRPVFKNARRPMMVFMFGKLFDNDNHFAHPFDFVVTVDLALGKVIAIDNLPTHSDYDANNRVGNICPKTPSNYDPKFRPASFLRTDLHPIRFSQPQGPSFKLRGNEISWQKFKLRIGFNRREGIVIHQVSYQDGPRRRPLFYRMSAVELFVPYGDPRPPYHQKFPFDEGKFTLGRGVIDHKLAGICKGGVVVYLDFISHDETGTPKRFPNAVCIYEEDAGILWAHEGGDGRLIHARSQRLVITMMTNLGNYEYQFSWRFHQDANIEFHMELNGIISAQMLAQNETLKSGLGTPVFPQINGQFHQHNIALRLDAEIDGNINSVSTLDIMPLPDPTGSPKNPYGQGWKTEEHLLRTPAEARTSISPFTGRNWMIRNPTSINPYTKKPVGWKLLPYNAPLPLIRKDSPLHPDCAYTDYNVWVTKFRENQLYPAGFYNNASGLPDWVRENPDEDITADDIVLWYNYGHIHVPRTEDFPVMPVEPSGIVLKPTNFFLENPGLDVPSSSS